MIKNIIFDIGNVMVVWNPATVVKRLFPQQNTAQLTRALFKSAIWFDLNRGKLTEAEAIQVYHQTLAIDRETLNMLMREIKASLVPIENSFDLLEKLQQANYTLYALTDNVPEIMTYLRAKYDFWQKFKGVVVSAEIGYLKPAPEIYQYLLNQYHLNPHESVFIDDYLDNVKGAKLQGMYGIQFESVAQCIQAMRMLKIEI